MKVRHAITLLAIASLPLAYADEHPADPAGTIILRADSPTGVSLSGQAKVGPAAKGNAAVEDGQTVLLGAWGKANTEESKVEFVPSIPNAGAYDVYVRWSAGGKATKAVTKSLPVRVSFDGGERSLTLDQVAGNVWAFLGTYPFKAGNSGKVSADAAGTQGASNISGVKFVPVSNPKEALAPIPKILPVTPGAQDDLDKLRLHAADIFTRSWSADVTEPIIADKVAQEGADAYFYWKTMQKGEGVKDLWSDIALFKGNQPDKNDGGGWQLTRSFERIALLAQAYVGSNAPLGFAAKMQGNPELLKDILYALQFNYEHCYNEQSKNKLGADWIGMEIQNPMNISKALILLYPHIPPELMKKEMTTMEKQSPGPDKYYGGAVSTGFNRLFGVYAYALRAIVAKNPTALDEVDRLISGEYQVNSRSNPISEGRAKKNQLDGYYADGSFIQHAYFPYIGIYGRGLLGTYAKLKDLLQGSKWEINNPKAGIFNEWVYRGYAPLFFGGEIMFGSLGRSTGQSWHQNGAVSSEILDALAPLVTSADAENRAKISSILKTWMIEKGKSAYPEFSKIDSARIKLESFAILNAIKEDTSIPLTHPAGGTHIFYNTDYVVHHQPDFAIQLRMFSTRTKTHEDINEGTNRLGWYQGEGSLFLYNRDNSLYNDNYFATVNPYRLPGITVDSRPRETPGSKDGALSASPWAGGVELDGFGLASMGLAEPETTLTAQKSWFFFGDQIICLGSEIRSSDNRVIETVVENVKLHGDGKNAFVVDGQAKPNTPGWQADLKDMKWAHLAGTVPGTDTGWVFPGGATIKALREARTGNWTNSFVKDNNAGDHVRNFLTLWYDHGANPAGATYAYIILPGKTADQTKAYAEKPGVEIVENSAKAQTVTSKELGVTGANFWTGAAHKSGGTSCSGKAAVLVHEQNGKLSVAVSDPTQLETGVEITLDSRVTKALKTDEGIKVVSLSPLKLSINLEKSDGRTFVAEFQK